MPQLNEVNDPHKPAKTMTAYEWLASDKPAAVQWRKEANLDAWNKVYDQAVRDHEHGAYISLPVEPIERPATGRESTHGRYFDVPVSQPHAKRGKYFTIPEDK